MGHLKKYTATIFKFLGRLLEPPYPPFAFYDTWILKLSICQGIKMVGLACVGAKKAILYFWLFLGSFPERISVGFSKKKRQMMTLLFLDKLWYSWRVSWTVNIMNTQVTLRNMVRWCFAQLFSILTILPRFSSCKHLWKSDFENVTSSK